MKHQETLRLLKEELHIIAHKPGLYIVNTRLPTKSTMKICSSRSLKLEKSLYIYIILYTPLQNQLISYAYVCIFISHSASIRE